MRTLPSLYLRYSLIRYDTDSFCMRSTVLGQDLAFIVTTHEIVYSSNLNLSWIYFEEPLGCYTIGTLLNWSFANSLVFLETNVKFSVEYKVSPNCRVVQVVSAFLNLTAIPSWQECISVGVICSSQKYCRLVAVTFFLENHHNG
jgi:hypothetical protein